VTLVNFHPSLLPSYRGPIPSYWVIENKEKYTGITMHKVTEKIDNGEIIYNKFLSILPGDTPEILDYKLSQIGSEILEEHFFDIISNNLKNSYYGFIKK
jgi:methionyl-tRNA formyltransferase